MKELQKILTLDRLIAEKKADIEINKRELIALEASRNAAATSALGMFDNLTELEDGDVKWKVQKGRPSVVIRDDVKIDSIPEELTRRSPDKRLILKAAKTNPESIAAFAEIQYSPDKLTYSII